MKKKVVIVGFYMSGIYPPAENNVVWRVLAASFLKAAADADVDVAKDYTIEILDEKTSSSADEVAEKVLASNPDVVAYPCYAWNYENVVESARLIKAELPDAKVVLGGPLVTYTSEEMMASFPESDVIVMGSGEIRFIELLKSNFEFDALEAISQITYRTGTGEIKRTHGTPKEDLDQIPSIYKTKTLDLDDGRTHTVCVETYRGCPFSCGYCTWGSESNRTVHKFSLESLLEDLEIIYNHPKVAMVFIIDACIFYTRKRAKVVIDKIASCSRKIPTVLTLDIHVLDEEMARYLSKLTIYLNNLHFGLQTTNPTALKLLNRPGGGHKKYYMDRLKILEDICPEMGIGFDIMIGLAGDNYAGFRQSIEDAIFMGANKLGFCHLYLLPGTPFWDNRVEHGFIYVNEPPYVVLGNNTYSRHDMDKSFRYSMWIVAIHYFRPIWDFISKLGKERTQTSITEAINKFIGFVQEFIDPICSMTYPTTVELNNHYRRQTMNCFVEPQNALIFYRAALQTAQIMKTNILVEEFRRGISYYEGILSDNEDQTHLTFSSTDEMSYILPYWKVSKVVAT